MSDTGRQALQWVAMWGLGGLMLLPLLAATVLRLIGKPRPASVVGAFAAGVAVLATTAAALLFGAAARLFLVAGAVFAALGALLWWTGRRAPLDPPAPPPAAPPDAR